MSDEIILKESNPRITVDKKLLIDALCHTCPTLTVDAELFAEIKKRLEFVQGSLTACLAYEPTDEGWVQYLKSLQGLVSETLDLLQTKELKTVTEHCGEVKSKDDWNKSTTPNG